MKTIIQKGEKELKQSKWKTLTIVETIGVSCTFIHIHADTNAHSNCFEATV